MHFVQTDSLAISSDLCWIFTHVDSFPMSGVLRNSRSLAGMANNSVSRWSLGQNLPGWFRGFGAVLGLQNPQSSNHFWYVQPGIHEFYESWNIHQQQSTLDISIHTYYSCESSVWLCCFPLKTITSSLFRYIYIYKWISVGPTLEALLKLQLSGDVPQGQDVF